MGLFNREADRTEPTPLQEAAAAVAEVSPAKGNGVVERVSHRVGGTTLDDAAEAVARWVNGNPSWSVEAIEYRSVDDMHGRVVGWDAKISATRTRWF